MDRLWQYQGRAEPLFSGPETVTVDRWAPVLPDYRRAVSLRQYQTHAGPVEPITAAEDVTLDKWHADQWQPLPRSVRQPQPGSWVVEPSLYIVPTTGWDPGVTDRPRTPPRYPQGDLVAPVEPPVAVAEVAMDWLTEPVLPQWRAAPRHPGIVTPVLEPSLTSVPPLDWLVPCAVWMRPPARLRGGVGIYVGEPIENPSGATATGTLTLTPLVSGTLTVGG